MQVHLPELGKLIRTRVYFHPYVFMYPHITMIYTTVATITYLDSIAIIGWKQKVD